MIFLFAWILSLLLVANAGAKHLDGRLNLTGGDLSTWRGDTGQWEVVGDTFINPKNEKLLSSIPGTGAVVNGSTGKTSHLISKAEFGDVKAHIEFMVSKGSNSGAYFAGRYEIQVYDSYGVPKDEYPGIECGGIYERWDENRSPKGYEGHSPRVNTSRPAGQWQVFDVIFRAPRFDESGKKVANARFEKIVHNGVVVHEDVELTGPTRSSAYDDEKPTGPLMLQGDHGPVAYRNIWIEPAGPNPFFAMDTATDKENLSATRRIEMLKRLDYAGIGYTGCDGLAEMLGELDRNELRLFTLYLGINIDPGRQKYDPKLKEAINLLKGRNTILCLFVKSMKFEPSSTDVDTQVVEIIREIADMAVASDLRVALYPDSGFRLERVEDALRLAKKVDRKNVGIAFNVWNQQQVSNQKYMKSLIISAMPYLFIAIVDGAYSSGEDWAKTYFNIYGFLTILLESGYTGPIGLNGNGLGGDAYEYLERYMNLWYRLSERLATTNN